MIFYHAKAIPVVSLLTEPWLQSNLPYVCLGKVHLKKEPGFSTVVSLKPQ